MPATVLGLPKKYSVGSAHLPPVVCARGMTVQRICYGQLPARSVTQVTVPVVVSMVM